MVEFVDLSTAEHWEAYVTLANAFNPRAAATVEQVKLYDKQVPEGTPGGRIIVYSGAAPVAAARFIQSYWYADPARFELRVFGSAEVGDATLEEASRRAQELGAGKLGGWARSDHEWMAAMFERAGFHPGQCNREVCLDLASFDPGEATLPDGYSIVPLSQLLESGGEQAKHEFWRLEMDIYADVPLPEPHKETPFDDFIKALDDPDLLLDWQFVALFGEQWVGQSQLHRNTVDPKVAATSITGVRRAHRRKGLATLLKISALNNAKSHGVEVVFTDTEEDNPMKLINQQLGFKSAYDWTEYSKTP